jgi:hypothetical protein
MIDACTCMRALMKNLVAILCIEAVGDRHADDAKVVEAAGR